MRSRARVTVTVAHSRSPCDTDRSSTDGERRRDTTSSFHPVTFCPGHKRPAPFVRSLLASRKRKESKSPEFAHLSTLGSHLENLMKREHDTSNKQCGDFLAVIEQQTDDACRALAALVAKGNESGYPIGRTKASA